MTTPYVLLALLIVLGLFACLGGNIYAVVTSNDELAIKCTLTVILLSLGLLLLVVST